MGIIFFALVIGCFPFNEAKYNDNYYKYLTSMYAKDVQHYWKYMAKDDVDKSFKCLFWQMVRPIPDLRPTIAQIRQNQFLAEWHCPNPHLEFISHLKNKNIKIGT